MNSAAANIVRRRVAIDFDSAPVDHWLPDKPIVETFLNTVSFFFPVGEKFFIETVNNYRDRITDPLLKDQVRRFIYQEGMHTKEHSICNRRLLQAYPLGRQIEWLGGACLNLLRWFTPRAYQLAATCAIEHYTALIADELLRSQAAFIQTAHPVFAQLWLWHAVEETEHKTVCFDVYRHVVGKGPISYLIRVIAMIVTSLFFFIALAIGMLLMMRRRSPDNEDNVRVELSGDIRKVRWSNMRGTGSLMPSWHLYLNYFKPSFHPSDNDNAHLISEWKQRFPGYGLSTLEIDAHGSTLGAGQGDHG